MRLLSLSAVPTHPITQFDSVAASSQVLAGGGGDAHVHYLRFEPGGSVGEHPTGFGQLLMVIEGAGWAIGAERQRIELTAGQAVFFERGEHHSKGSDSGMTALMIQVTDLQLFALASGASRN